MFPVAEHPVFSTVPDGPGERRITIPGKKAIVNLAQNRVVGIVGRDYRLVSNRVALELAHQCCRTVFPATSPAEWEVSAADGPATGGHCTIDLTHNSAALDFSLLPAEEKPEVFGPFIRVTNSYNGMRALGFDIGFHRKVCKNGLILPQSIIRFKFTHSRRDLRDAIEFEVARDQLAETTHSFQEYLRALTECPIDRVEFEPLIDAVLLIRPPAALKDGSRDAADWGELRTRLREVADRYHEQLGENAYAVFNAITDFASHPPVNRLLQRERHSLQRRAGQWLTDFSQTCRAPGFKVSEYVDELNKKASAQPARA
jgi:hypothetical protein